MIENPISSKRKTRPTKLSKNNIEAIFALRPNQSAMVLSESNGGKPANLVQLRMKLHGALNKDAFKKAWQLVTDRHQALRSSLHIRASVAARIVVWKSLPCGIDFTDLQNLSRAEQSGKLEFILADNQVNGVLVQSPSVNFIDVFQLAAESHFLIWRSHHMFLDGWSSAIVIDELMMAYDAIMRNVEPDLPKLICTYHDYLHWLGERDDGASNKFWADRLAGYQNAEPSGLLTGPAHPTSQDSDDSSVELIESQLTPEESARLKQTIACNRLTANAVCQGVWAILLRKMLGRDRVVFANVESARPASLVGIQNLAGMLANQVPVCIEFIGGEKTSDWMRRIRDDAFEVQNHSTVTMVEMPCLPLQQLESLLVVQNFPTVLGRANDTSRLVVSEYQSDLETSMPLAINIIPGPKWTIRIRFDQQAISAADAIRISNCFRALLLELPERLDSTLDDLLNTESINSIDRLLSPTPKTNTSANTVAGRQPSSETEARLAMIWAATLGIQSICIDSDFFECGGKSITAIRLFARIEEVFNQTLSPALLMGHSTISSLAKLIDLGSDSVPDVLVPIRKSGNKTPLIGVHSGGDYSYYYRHLVKYLDQDRPVWGIHPVGLEGTKAPHRSVSEMVRHNSQLLLNQFPEGGFHLVGYCIGAAVSVEMARQLIADGIDVRSLTVFDSGPAQVRPKKVPISRFLSGDSAIKKAKGLSRYAIYRGSLIKHGLQGFGKRMYSFLPGKHELRRQLFMRRVENLTRNAFISFDQQQVDIPILLIRSSEYAGRADKSFHLDWARHTPDLRVEIADAGHENFLLEPDVKGVAEILNDHLRD